MANPVVPADLATWLPAGAISGIATEVVQAHLDAAWGAAWGVLGNRGYPAEGSAAGAALTKAVCQIAAWTLLVYRGVNPEEPGHAAVAKSHDDAMRWLDKVASGEIGLGPGATPVRTPNRTIGAFSVAPGGGANGTRGW